MFSIRLKRQWQNRFTFWREIVDWVIVLYLVVPSSAFLYFFVRETIWQGDYGVLELVPPLLLAGVLLLLASMLESRSFVEQADRLFVIQHKRAFTKLKRFAYSYSFVINIVILAVPYMLLVPLWLRTWTALQLMQLALALVLGFVVGDGLRYVKRRWLRWGLQVFLLMALISSVMWAYPVMLLITGCLIVVSVLAVDRLVLQGARHFAYQVELEAASEGRMQSMLLQMNPDLKHLQLQTLQERTPKMWRKLYSTTKRGALVELILKSMYRNRSYLSSYIRLVLIMVPLLYLLPLWAKAIVFVFFIFGMRSYIDALVVEIAEHNIFHILRFSKDDWNAAISKVKAYAVYPAASLYAVLIIWQYFSS